MTLLQGPKDPVLPTLPKVSKITPLEGCSFKWVISKRWKSGMNHLVTHWKAYQLHQLKEGCIFLDVSITFSRPFFNSVLWFYQGFRFYMRCACPCAELPHFWAYSRAFLVWPQWWSFAGVSQQGVDFSKKISKRKIFFWFDFHRCSHGPSKIGPYFRKQSSSKIEVFKKCQIQKTYS